MFLNGNGFPDRFSQMTTPVCTVAETGFGTGLNFLTLWQSFLAFRNANPVHPLKRLHFISFEKFPLTVADLQAAHRHWPEFADFSLQLCAQWPQPLPVVTVFSCPAVKLPSIYGWEMLMSCSLPSLTRWTTKSTPGFSTGLRRPKPDMWQQSLFDLMIRFSKPGGTFATFTAAGLSAGVYSRPGLTLSAAKALRTSGNACPG